MSCGANHNRRVAHALNRRSTHVAKVATQTAKHKAVAKPVKRKTTRPATKKKTAAPKKHATKTAAATARAKAKAKAAKKFHLSAAVKAPDAGQGQGHRASPRPGDTAERPRRMARLPQQVPPVRGRRSAITTPASSSAVPAAPVPEAHGAPRPRGHRSPSTRAGPCGWRSPSTRTAREIAGGGDAVPIAAACACREGAFLSGLAMPGGLPPMVAYIMPPDPNVEAEFATAYVWPTEGDESRDPEKGGASSRNTGPGTPAGTKPDHPHDRPVRACTCRPTTTRRPTACSPASSTP